MNYKEFKTLNKEFKEVELRAYKIRLREIHLSAGNEMMFIINADGICRISVSAFPSYIVKSITIDELKKLYEKLSKFFN